MNQESPLHFNILTLFPALLQHYLTTSLIGRAVRRKLVTFELVDIRKFGVGKHKNVDDYGLGRRVGMLLRYDVLKQAKASIADIATTPTHTVHLSPRGKPLTQKILYNLLAKSPLTIICGHYEGIDQRFIDTCVDEEISLGDYVLASGESAAIVLLDGLIRLKKDVLGNQASLAEESFSAPLLEYAQYTRPYDENVPAVLRSGHHQAIDAWQHASSLVTTYCCRPDLLKHYSLSLAEKKTLKRYVYRKFAYFTPA